MQFDEIQHHSKLAFDKWKDLWIGNCKANMKRIATSHRDYLGIYEGKIAVLFSYGPSFEKNVEEFKASDLYKNPNVVVGCVDKAFRPLVQRNIFPDHCIIADGSIDPDWFKGVPDHAVQSCVLISNVYARPEWSEHWERKNGKKSILWYLNKDNLNTHDFFGNIANYYEVIPAASNVSNSLVVFFRQIFGCRTFYLCGFNFSWKKGKYYGAEDHKKKNFLGMLRQVDINGDLVWASTNMDFSRRWLENYCVYSEQNFGCTFVNCSGEGMLNIVRKENLNNVEICRY